MNKNNEALNKLESDEEELEIKLKKTIIPGCLAIMIIILFLGYWTCNRIIGG